MGSMKSIVSCLACILVVPALFAQDLTGGTTSFTESTGTYEIEYDGSVSGGWTFSTTSGGTVLDQEQSGIVFSASIRWNCPGSQSVSFIANSSTIASLGVTVTCKNNVTTPSTTFNYSIGCGTTTITRTSDPPANTIWYWQTSSTGTSTSNSSNSYPVTSAGPFYLRPVRGTGYDCCWGTAQTTSTVTIIVPQPPTNSNPSAYACGPGQIALSASVGSQGDQVKWFDTESSSTVLYTGNSYSPTISGSRYFYAASYNSTYGCYSTRLAIYALMYDLPPAPTSATATPSTSCGSFQTVLSATGLQVGTEYVWFDVPTGGTPLGSTTQTITSSKTFYVALRYASICDGPRISVAVTYNPPSPSVQTVSGGGTYCVSSASPAVTLNSSQTGYKYQLYKQGSGAQGIALDGLNSTALNWTGLTAGIYTVTAANPNGSCSVNMTGSATIVGDAATIGGSVSPETTHAFGVSTGALTLGGSTGSVLRWEKLVSGSWQPVSNTTGTLNYANDSTTTSYRAVLKNGVCAEAPSAAAAINIYTSPGLTADQDVLPYAGKTTLHTGTGYASYTWYKNNEVISGQITPNLEVTVPSEYKVKVTQGTAEYTTGNYKIFTPFTVDHFINGPGPTSFNMNGTTMIYKEGVKENTSLYTLQPSDLAQQIVYNDALGRPYNAIAVGQSPLQRDLVNAMLYSAKGLPEKSYLPYAADKRLGMSRYKRLKGISGLYEDSEQRTFYQNAAGVAHDDYPYAQKVLSQTMAPTVKEQGAPGAAWQVGGGHTVKYDLTFNSDNEVRIWKPDGTTSAYYTAKTIAISQVTDENGNKVLTYSDKLGRTLLKRVQVDTSTWLATYYIYDEYNRLKYQVPPKAVTTLGSGSTLDANNSSVTELIYKYTYDDRGRLVEKKVPGAVAQYYIYDKFDRLILSQDGNLRSSNKWVFIKYDGKQRPIMTGLYQNTTNTTRSSVQDVVNTQFQSVTRNEIRGTTAHGYTNTSFPDATAGTVEDRKSVV